MDKQYILDEIRRTASENGGTPLGKARFARATGISTHDWYGKHWARWGDALVEAGYTPNTLQGRLPDDVILDHLIALIEKLDRYPTHGELRLQAKRDSSFPSHTTFRRIGRKATLAARAITRCQERGGLEHVQAICEPIASKVPTEREALDRDEAFGCVYLMRSGKHYKIGRSNSVGRREYELGIQLPEKLKTVHVIRTDDPSGIETYWHNRFADRRKGGEWFALTSDDIRAFKRREFM